MTRTLRAVLGLGLLLGAGCGGGQAANRPQTGAKLLSCPGQQVVIATNDWNEAVELYAYITDSAQPQLLGRLNPTERVEFGLPAGTESVKSVPARAIAPSYEPPAMKQLVRFRYLCR
ncbi:MAG TPA: hypothetical protein VL241_09235 [Gemmatimonadales bacterium]|nr:hypothetical protein [Gemmatimonadales bacterium]